MNAVESLFANYADWILFFHVMAAIVWVGGMIAIRFAVHPSLQHIEDPTVRLARTLEVLGNFFTLVIPMIVIIIATAVVMSLGLNFKEGDPGLNKIVHVKEGIWLLMSAIFATVYIRRNRAERLFVGGDLAGAKMQLEPIAAYLIPANILLGMLALYLGGILRGL